MLIAELQQFFLFGRKKEFWEFKFLTMKLMDISSGSNTRPPHRRTEETLLGILLAPDLFYRALR